MAASKEVRARIKINKLLEKAGWRFFDDENGKANIHLEQNVKLTHEGVGSFSKDADSFGEDFVNSRLSRVREIHTQPLT